MSGLEVVGLVAAISSAFTGAASLYRTWREQRRERKEREANKQLEMTVSQAGTVVQQRYDNDYRRLGQIFARGDETGRLALMEQLVTVQQTVIGLLTSDNARVNPIATFLHPNHDAIYRSSQNVQSDTVRALSDLFQRLSQTRPIAPTVPQAYGRPALPRHHSTPALVNSGFNCFTPLQIGDTDANHDGDELSTCRNCDWTAWIPVAGGVRTLDNRELGMYCTLQKFHYKANGEYYQCFICKDRRVLQTDEALEMHVRQYHNWAQICNGQCPSSQSMCGRPLPLRRQETR